MTAALATELAEACGQRTAPASLVMFKIRPHRVDHARQHRLGAHEDAAEVDLDGAPSVVSADLPSVPERPLILALLTSSRIGPSCPRITVIAVTCQTVSASSFSTGRSG